MTVVNLEIKQTVDALASTWELFKKENDARLKAIETKGFAPADLEDKVNRINAALDLQTRSVETLIAVANRTGIANESKEEKLQKAYEQFGKDVAEGKLSTRAVAIGSNTTGGYAVESVIESDMARVLKASSPMRAICTTVTQRAGTSAYVKLVAQNDAASANNTENVSARSDTNSGTMQKISIPTNTIEAQVVVTPEAIEDTVIDPQNWLFNDVTEQFVRQEANQFVVGTGSSNTALGFAGTGYTRNATRTWGQVTKLVTTSGSPAKIIFDDIITLQFSVIDPGYVVNGAYGSNPTTLGNVRKLKDSYGRYLAEVSPAVLTNANGDLTNTWICLGKPWHVLPDMATNEIAFADWKKFYYIVDRIGMYSVVDVYSKKPNTEFYFRKRTGGAVMDSNAGAILAMS